MKGLISIYAHWGLSGSVCFKVDTKGVVKTFQTYEQAANYVLNLNELVNKEG